MSTIDLTRDSDGENDPVGDAPVAYALPTLEWLDSNAMRSNPVALRAHATMMSYALGSWHLGGHETGHVSTAVRVPRTVSARRALRVPVRRERIWIQATSHF